MTVCSGPLDGKGKDRIDSHCPGRHHHRAIEAERDAAAVGEAGFESREQMLVDGGPGEAEPAAFLHVSLEAAALLACASQLVKPVGKLDAVAVELEALGGTGVVRIEPGERRLARGITGYEGQRILAESRPDYGAHQQLEQRVAPGRSAVEAGAARGRRELRQGCREGIERDRLQESLAVAHADAAARGGGRVQEL